MTQAEKLEALIETLDKNTILVAVPELKGFPLGNASLVATYLIITHRVEQLLFSNHRVARALFGEEEKEWLGRFVWYSLYEQDSYTFQDAQELLDSWVYQGGGQKPTVAELEGLSPEGIEACAGTVQKRVETTIKGFRYHLQDAVISGDPIGYMYKAVFGE